jgi:hypothetical protein
MKRIGFIAICTVLLLLAGGVAEAQGDDYDVGRSVISTGGGERESGDYTIIDVIGQPTSGRSGSGALVLQAASARSNGNGFILVSGFLTLVHDDYNGMMPVGGDVTPVNRLAVIAPWLVLAALIILTMTVAVLMKRKHVA